MEKAVKRIQRNIGKYLVLTLTLFSVWSGNVMAATLNFSPSSGSFSQNTNFAVNINVSSPDQAMNAASLTIKFPNDKVQVVSVSKSGSIVDFWAQEPSFSNTTGEIKLEGVVLTPGYKGSSGKLLTVNLRGKNIGPAVLSIVSSSVLANDGVGTNILTSVNGASFNIVAAEVKEPEVIQIKDLTPTDEEPIAPVKEGEVCKPDSLITSSTHPGIIWRKENSVAFSWHLPEGTLASKISFDRNPNSEPSVINNPAIVEKRYEDLEDGVWYFHLSLQNNDKWSKTEHFQIKIDQTAPNLQATEVPRASLKDPRPIINLSASDEMSCVEKIELSINGEILDYEKLPNGDFKLQKINPGAHELVVTAYDRAGNSTQRFIYIVVESLEPALPPVLPEKINMENILAIGLGLLVVLLVILKVRASVIKKNKQENKQESKVIKNTSRK
jgi:hypothetical protein